MTYFFFIASHPALEASKQLKKHWVITARCWNESNQKIERHQVMNKREKCWWCDQFWTNKGSEANFELPLGENTALLWLRLFYFQPIRWLFVGNNLKTNLSSTTRKKTSLIFLMSKNVHEKSVAYPAINFTKKRPRWIQWPFLVRSKTSLFKST